MAVEFHESLIKKIQMGFRKEAALSSYDPDQPSIPRLPTLHEVISGFDPSPPYLRCNQCHGSLLRGLQSTVCVYCGAQQRRDGPPITVSFKSTVGYRMLLESLELDGSEAVSLIIEPNESTKGQSTSKDGLVLSDLLDLELSWPVDLKEIENSNTNKAPTQTISSLNLSGVDLDNFFSEAKADASFAVSEEQLLPPKQIISTDSHAYSGQESFDLFENIQSSDMGVSSVDTEGGEFGDSFSGWEAEFKSANTEAPPVDTKSFDPFLGSSTINLSSSMEAPSTIDPGIDIEFTFINKGNDGELKHDSGHLSSMSNNLGQDDLWQDNSTELPKKTDQLNMISKGDDGVPKNGPNQLSSNSDWIQDDLWQRSNAKASKTTENIIGNNDSFDAWQDFTGSGDEPDPFSSSCEQTSNERASEMNSADLNDKFQELEFGGFLQTNLPSGNILAGPTDVSNVQIEGSLSDRKEGTEMKTVVDAKSQVPASEGENFSGTMQFESSDSNVDTLISQMPDLSFMLESNLSIPKKDEGSDLIL